MTTLPTETVVRPSAEQPTATPAAPPAKKKPRLVGTTAWYVVALFVCAVMIVPLLWMITIGLKSRTAVFDIPPKLLPHEWTWSNFVNGPKAIHFPRLLLNSVIITALSVLGGVMTAMMAGYALARLRFPGRKVWFYLFVGSMLLPGVVGLIPLFQLYKSIGWYDTWLPLIVPAFLGGNPLFIFLARQYFLAIPYSIDEAAKIDGAGPLRRFHYVVVPIIRPILFVGLLYSIVFSFTDFSAVWLLTQGGPYNTTHVFGTYAYNIGINAGDIGMGAAITLFIFPLLAITVTVMLRLLRRE